MYAPQPTAYSLQRTAYTLGTAGAKDSAATPFDGSMLRQHLRFIETASCWGVCNQGFAQLEVEVDPMMDV